MKKIIFALTVLLSLSSFAASKTQCAETYLDAYYDLEEIARSFNQDSSYSDGEFIADYTVHKAELLARNTDCKFALSRLEKIEISKCSNALKDIYDGLDDGISISRSIFSSRVEEIEIDSKFISKVKVTKAKAVCLVDGINLN